MFKFVKILTSLVIFTFLTLIFTGNIFASTEVDLPREQINPGSVAYTAKRAWEKVREVLSFTSQSKVDLYKDLIKKRISELNYVTDKKMLGEVEKTSGRFSSYAGKLVEEELKVGNKDKYKDTIEEFDDEGKKLEVMRDRFPANSSYWMLIQYSIDTVKNLQNKLK